MVRRGTLVWRKVSRVSKSLGVRYARSVVCVSDQTQFRRQCKQQIEGDGGRSCWGYRVKTVDVLQLSVAGLAVAISVATAFYAAKVSREVSSGDYASSERVKWETAKLLASLRSIATKGVHALIFKGKMDLTEEQESINEFINSPTAFAYYAWAGLKSDQAGQGVAEKWRLLFYRLSQLSHSKDPHGSVQLAVELEGTFDSLTEGDLKIIVEYNSDLIEGLANSKQGRAGDPMLTVLHELLGEREAQEGENEELVMRQLAFLKGLALGDPDVDLALAVLQQDLDGAAGALARGGNMHAPIGEVLSRHKAQLARFEED